MRHVFPLRLRRKYVKFDGVRYRITGVRADGIFARRTDAPLWWPDEFFSFGG